MSILIATLYEWFHCLLSSSRTGTNSFAQSASKKKKRLLHLLAQLKLRYFSSGLFHPRERKTASTRARSLYHFAFYFDRESRKKSARTKKILIKWPKHSVFLNLFYFIQIFFPHLLLTIQCTASQTLVMWMNSSTTTNRIRFYYYQLPNEFTANILRVVFRPIVGPIENELSESTNGYYR